MVLDAKFKNLLLHKSEGCALNCYRLDAVFVNIFSWDFELRCNLDLILFVTRELSLILLWRHLSLNGVNVGHGCGGNGNILGLVDGFGVGALSRLHTIRLFVKSL